MINNFVYSLTNNNCLAVKGPLFGVCGLMITIQRRVAAFKALLEIISRDPIGSIQKLVPKGSPGITRHLDGTLYKL